MCGIVGILDPHLAPPACATPSLSLNLLTHRGPDDEGTYTGNGVALGARRLSIIDLESGHQPLSNEDGSIWIAYNGEVYNAPELRHELEALGHCFKTHTDTEAIVHAYEQWGAESVARLRGMFAYAIWDAHRPRLLLVRDRFGIKPLYYAEVNGHFAFASEIRPTLAALPQLSPRLNREALWHLFEVGFIPSPLTAFDFRIVTYNLYFGGVNRVDAIYDVLKHANADAVALNEADDQSIVRALADRLEMHHVWARGSGDRHIATLSCHPIIESRIYNRPPLTQAILMTKINRAGRI